MHAASYTHEDVTESLKAKLLDRLEKRQLNLPMLPQAAAQALAAAQDDASSVRALAELIHRDQAMAGHLLRIANSPMFAARTRIVSLRQAIIHLGMKNIAQLALMLSSRMPAFRVRGFEREVEAMFQHSFAAALTAQELARIKGLNVEEACATGLLHDLGEPVVLQAIVDIDRASGTTPLPREAVFLAVDSLHAVVGAALAEVWAFPPRLVEAIRHHHQPALAPMHANIARVVQVADVFADLVLDPALEDEEFRSHPAVLEFGLAPSELDRLLAKRSALLETVHAIG